MEVSNLIIKIFFLLLPGGVACVFYWRFVGRNTQKDWEDFLDIVLFALASYGTYALLLETASRLSAWFAWGFNFPDFSRFRGFLDERAELNLVEIFISCVLAIPLAALAALATNKRWIGHFGRKLKITNRVDDFDVWTWFHNGHNKESNWIVVRDHKLGLVYEGWFESYSDSGKSREMVLKDVKVYDDDSEFLYDVQAMYLARSGEELTIEIMDDVEETLKDKADLAKGPQALGGEKPKQIESHVKTKNG